MDANVIVVGIGVIGILVIAPSALRRAKRTYDGLRGRRTPEG